MNPKNSKRWITITWISGLFQGIFGLLIYVALHDEENFTRYINLDWMFLVDIGLTFILVFGVYRKSRVCASVLFLMSIYSFLNKYFMFESSPFPLISVIFTLIYFQGVRGTFAYHVYQNGTEIEFYKKVKNQDSVVIAMGLISLGLLFIITFLINRFLYF